MREVREEWIAAVKSFRLATSVNVCQLTSMATAVTHRALSARLERDVERHGCGQLACDICADREECVAVAPARPAVRREAVRAAEVPAHEESLVAVFGNDLACY